MVESRYLLHWLGYVDAMKIMHERPNRKVLVLVLAAVSLSLASVSAATAGDTSSVQTATHRLALENSISKQDPRVARLASTDLAPPDALAVLDPAIWLDAPPIGALPKVSKAEAEAEYARESSQGPQAGAPRKTVLAVAHLNNVADVIPPLVWAVGVDLKDQAVTERPFDATVWKNCGQVFLVDASTGQQVADIKTCPSKISDWFTTAKTSRRSR